MTATDDYITQIQNLVNGIISSYDVVQSSGKLSAGTRTAMNNAIADLKAELTRFTDHLRQCQVNQIITGVEGQKLFNEIRKESATLMGRRYTNAELNAMTQAQVDQIGQGYSDIVKKDKELLEKYRALRDAQKTVGNTMRQVANSNLVYQDAQNGIFTQSPVKDGDIIWGLNGQGYLVQDEAYICTGPYCQSLTDWTTSPYPSIELDLGPAYGNTSVFLPSDWYLDGAYPSGLDIWY